MKIKHLLFCIAFCSSCFGELFVFNHPLLLHKLSILRNKETSCNEFQRVLREIGQGMAYEITRDLPVTTKEIETPLQKMQAPFIGGKKLCLVSIMRAGNGLLEGVRDFIPSAKVAHVGIYRDPITCKPIKYYQKFPKEMDKRDVIVLDPILGTGGTAVATIDIVKEQNPRSIKFACVLAAPEGIKKFKEHHPDVPIYVTTIDDCLNEKNYLLPGLGDAGDRIYGTK